MTENFGDNMSRSELEDFLSFSDLIRDAPDLGLFQLTVKDAAVLVAIDIWFAGGISVELPDADSYDWRDPELRQALSKHSIDYEKRLTAAINKGSLKITKIRRNLKEELDTDKTLVNIEALKEWLTGRGHEVGEAFQDCFDEEAEIYNSAEREIRTRKMMLKHQGLKSKIISIAKFNPEIEEINELRLAAKELLNDNMDLFTKKRLLEEEILEIRENHPKKIERPLSTRARRTFLTIIAALCNVAGINYKDRGAAKRISELTDEIGAPVSDETIRPIISEIDDAVESRMK
jgi:hypothetical protein